MVVNSAGHIFECRTDGYEKYGVLENYRILYKDNILKVDITCPIDSNAKLTQPAIRNASSGFKP